MDLRRFRALAAAVAAPTLLLLAGCGGEGNDPERAVKEATGIETGSDTQTTGVETQQYRVEDTRTVVDQQTGEVVGQQTKTTDVTVQEETEVRREVQVESGETTTETKGFVPEGLGEAP